MQNDQPVAEQWLYRSSDPGAEPGARLFCLPYAGSGASAYRLWPDAVPEGIEVCRFQYPGRESRFKEPAIGNIGQMVQNLKQVMLPLLDRPFALFGHSMGGLLAFETARELAREGHAEWLRHLFVSGWRAPDSPPADPIADLPNDQLAAKLQNRYGAMGNAFKNPEVMELMLPVLRGDLRLVESYRYREAPPLKCRLTVLGGAQDHWVPADRLPLWQRQTRGSFDVRVFPGDHFYVTSMAEELAAETGRALLADVAQQPTPMSA